MLPARCRGFTLLEMMVVVALIGVVLVIAAPSFSTYITTQRLKSVNAALVTDIQYARSEAASRGKQVFMQFRAGANGAPSCYTIYADQVNGRDRCDCTQAPGSACPAGTQELRTVQLPGSQPVSLRLADGEDDFSFHPLTGGIYFDPSDVARPLPNPFVVETVVDRTLRLRVTVGLGGRPTVCAPAGAAAVPGGYPAC